MITLMGSEQEVKFLLAAGHIHHAVFPAPEIDDMVPIGGREVAMIFADVRLPGAMGGVDLAWEVKLRWPLLPMILTSGHPLERIRELPPGVAYMPKPWQPLNVLIAAEQALASGQGN